MEYKVVIDELIAFRNQKNWQKYHTLPGLARALSVESAEVNQLFLWQDSENDDVILQDGKAAQDLKMELADTLTYAYYMCEKLGVEPNDLVHEKLQTNKKRHWKFDED
ncbi:MazG-like family protein [Secundilactobacillus paracollinoides]|uniref:Nucleotide pyrophosphohydrolase n=1 Tax=Secundilactobacillus paracollinoides TaxID=240427 RepID=A0A1B2IY98_9LACO|nr:MazG-like family protein [Secundilactobacillus paracollinoides]ANZ61095.1 nucleotide pyrophosphohydrolase [Secundilactobacillus paracollinoides]ANZ67017.1 nucleotide pyrophosphohydrolase [Secundilactobacillus paracollinoides]